MPTTKNKGIHGFFVRNAIKSFFVTSSVELAQEALDQHNGGYNAKRLFRGHKQI